MSLDRYRTAIVTGASRGIGAAIVRQLRIGGLEVWAVARRPMISASWRARPAVGRWRSTSPSRCGAERPERPRRRHPGQQRLGSVKGGVSWETAPDAIDALTAVNIKGTLNCLRHRARHEGSGRGHIVNLGSIAAVSPIPGMPVYAMTKAAIRSLGQTPRLDLHGTRVSEISPGRVETGAHLALAMFPRRVAAASMTPSTACSPTTSQRPSCSCWARRSAWT